MKNKHTYYHILPSGLKVRITADLSRDDYGIEISHKTSEIPTSDIMEWAIWLERVYIDLINKSTWLHLVKALQDHDEKI